MTYWLDSTMADLRYGLRQLRRTPAVTLAILLSLAVGLGANAAIFSLLDAALLKPLPVADPGSLVIVEWTHHGFPEDAENINGYFRRIAGDRSQGSSVPAFVHRRLAREQTAFAALVGIVNPDAVAIATGEGPAEQVSLQYVSANFFQGLGVAPVAGRPFRDEDDRIGGEPVAIVSHRFWLTRLGGADLGDRRVRINNVPTLIAGVAPEGFFGLRAGQWTDVYAPLAAKAAFAQPSSGGQPRGENDRDWWVRQVARLRPGSEAAAAVSELNALFGGIVSADRAAAAPQLVTMPGRRGFDALGAADARALWILMLLVGVLLLLVCANVANLLLSRAVARQREFVVRIALGAGRRRLFRQHLIESVLVAAIGGAAGLVLGSAIAHYIHVLFQTGRDASSGFDLRLDLRVIAYTGTLSMLAACLFGLAPAASAARADLGEMLKAQTRSVSGGRLRLPRALVSVQIALCLTALVAGGLLGRSLVNLKLMEVGFDRENLAYASMSPARAGYSPDRIGPYADRVGDELARLPGVVRVSPVTTRLLSETGNHASLNIPGRPYQQGVGAFTNRVGGTYFETMRIPLLAGRLLAPGDSRTDGGAVVVDDLFVRRYFPEGNPLGRRFGFGPKGTHTHEIVGVVGHTRYFGLRGDEVPNLYQPYKPDGTVHFAIRTSMDAAALAGAVRQAVASVDPAVPLTEFRTQAALIDRVLRTDRLLSFVSAGFGLLALTLAAVGLGALLAYTVARRTNEIGVRMALGAAAGDVVRMVVRDSLWMVGAGVILGLPCAYAIARVLRSMLFRLEPFDVRIMAASLVVLGLVAIFAAWIPARRAARIDPVVALRAE
jgi:predicted permease